VTFAVTTAEAPGRAAAEADEPQASIIGHVVQPESSGRPVRRPRVASGPAPRLATRHPGRERPRSTPPVRTLARQLGIDLEQVTGTGPGGLITRDDVTALATRISDAGPVIRIPIRGVRKHTAAAMVASKFTAPHVTVFHTIDATAALELAARLTAESGGVKISLLAIASRAVCLALAGHPELNSRWEDATQEIVQYGYVNLGIAAATERGLVVPNLKSAETLALPALAVALADLTAEARAGKASPERLTGGTFTITNIGVFGVEAGTPILNPGEAGILALGAAQRRPWEFEGGIALRQVMTLSLSFDHRVVDGEQGSRFIVEVGRMLSDPDTALLMGVAG
jgi:pyruvate dehydrogenase E2 component (dihydrolipoamide acetyltransferase)